MNNQIKKKVLSLSSEIIKEYEGFKDRAYFCSAGVLTIGYGNTYNPYTNRKVKLGDSISKKEAELWLDFYVSETYEIIIKKIPELNNIGLNANQWASLLSFIYNVGKTNFIKSTLLKTVLKDKDDFKAVETQFLRWVYANKKKLKGLEIRRKKEFAIYCQ